jgi:hypothetical protein
MQFADRRWGSHEEDPRRLVQRDLLPMPLMALEEAPSTSLSRGTRQRVLKRMRHSEACNDAVKALNWMAGFESVASSQRVSATQFAARQHISSVLVDSKVVDPCMDTDEAVRTLLGQGPSYTGSDAANIASYDPELLSVPGAGDRPVSLTHHLPVDARTCLVDFEQHLLVSDDEWGRICETEGPMPVYMDPILKHDKSKCYEFVGRLTAAGLLSFSTHICSRVGLFFVKKKNGKIRLVIDCRATNRRFKRCPYLPMGTGASWTELVIDPHVDAYFSSSDIKDYFYECEIPDKLRPYFALPDIPISVARRFSVDPDMTRMLYSLDDSVYVAPVLKVLPMGWTWSFFFG